MEDQPTGRPSILLLICLYLSYNCTERLPSDLIWPCGVGEADVVELYVAAQRVVRDLATPAQGDAGSQFHELECGGRKNEVISYYYALKIGRSNYLLFLLL